MHHLKKLQTNFSIINKELFVSILLLLFICIVPSFSQITISGTVKDNLAVPVENSEVQALNQGSQTIVASDFSDAVGEYFLDVAPGTYDFKVIPPEVSGFAVALVEGKEVLGNMVLNFVLVPIGSAYLQGRRRC